MIHPTEWWQQLLTRRQFLHQAGWYSGWASLGTAALGSLAGSFRFMVPQVLYEPPTIFKIGRPDEFGLGVTNKLKKERQIWVVRDEAGLYVLISICRHLGCTPNWLGDQQRFRCPCHGSIYDIYGNVRGGPAPRTLWRTAVRLDPVDDQVIVNFLTRQDPEPKSTVEGLMVDETSRRVEPFFLSL